MRRSSADHEARCTPVHPFASRGRSAPLASMRCVDTTLPPPIVVTSAASPPCADGVMHTNESLSAGAATADAPGTDVVQHPTHARHFGPTRSCCAEAVAAKTATNPSAARQRFIETFIVWILMNEPRAARRARPCRSHRTGRSDRIP